MIAGTVIADIGLAEVVVVAVAVVGGGGAEVLHAVVAAEAAAAAAGTAGTSPVPATNRQPHIHASALTPQSAGLLILGHYHPSAHPEPTKTPAAAVDRVVAVVAPAAAVSASTAAAAQLDTRTAADSPPPLPAPYIAIEPLVPVRYGFDG